MKDSVHIFQNDWYDIMKVLIPMDRQTKDNIIQKNVYDPKAQGPGFDETQTLQQCVQNLGSVET
jgi:hypothetical protein